MVLFVYMQVEWNKYLAWCYNPHKAMFYVHNIMYIKQHSQSLSGTTLMLESLSNIMYINY